MQTSLQSKQSPLKMPNSLTSVFEKNYAINWLIDGLPAARDQTAEPSLNNHYDITIQYHTQDKKQVSGCRCNCKNHSAENMMQHYSVKKKKIKIVILLSTD
ncbi:unnamed protein product [Rhizophagus irregularis]|nr:unnamed protein product [Rhizophagus irregularis]